MKNIVMFSCICMLSIVSCTQDHEHLEEVSTLEVSLPVKKDTIINKEFIAQIRAYQHVELRALDEGYLQKIYVDEGQFVKKGQLLFQLLPIVYQSEQQIAKAEFDRAEIEYKNTKMLADSNIVSKNELSLSKANLDKAKAELALRAAKLQFTEIRAPFDGIVGRFNQVRQGSLLEEGELLTTLSDNSKMWVYFNVPEAVYLDYIRTYKSENQKQSVTLQLADGLLFDKPGIIETIESDFNNETGNIAFRATFDNSSFVLRHGQTGRILMPQDLKGALLLPQKATFEVLDKKFVYVIKKGKVEAREISVKNELPHLYEVSKGLTEKDTVLMDGLRKVKKGDRILSKYKPFDEIIQELIQIKAE
ncbi:MAG: efflux RND transporter periplasmic adaptor subunit [Candidatus Kapabacteria bacterium]|nr:efflux RND transporter periplasmic adaptor subunit [Candidatus Kapabacteria bacterium]